LGIHCSVKDFIFLRINRPVTRALLNPHNIFLVEDVSMHWKPSKQKFIVDFHPKQNIVVHQVLLRWMLANGFRVTKIHRTLQFDQKSYMKKFIDTFVSKHSEVKIKG